MKKKEIEYVRNHLQEKSVISRQELLDIIITSFDGKKIKYASLYFFDLYRNNVVYPYYKGLFHVCGKRTPFSLLGNIGADFIGNLTKIRPSLPILCWNTSILNEMMVHQPTKTFTIVETYQYGIEAVLMAIKHNNNNVILKKDKNNFEKYFSTDSLILVGSMNEDSPMITKIPHSKTFKYITNESIVKYPKIEKILVDIYCDDIFDYIDSGEVKHIFNHCFEKYQINLTTLLRYAKSRNKRDELFNYITSINFDIEKGEFNYDR